jgi:hypothetical protein
MITKWRMENARLRLLAGVPLTMWGIYSISSVDNGGDKGTLALVNMIGLIAGIIGFYWGVVSGLSILFTGKKFSLFFTTHYYCTFCKHEIRQLPDPGTSMTCPGCGKVIQPR